MQHMYLTDEGTAEPVLSLQGVEGMRHACCALVQREGLLQVVHNS